MIEYNLFGDNARIHHVGMVVKSIREVDPDLDIIEDKIQNVLISFVKINGIDFELLESTGEESPINKSLLGGKKIVHICYEVDDLNDAIQRCREFGFHNISPISPAIAFNMQKITWVYNKIYGLFELVERPKDER